jgi:ketosteroid isomerase-like protein
MGNFFEDYLAAWDTLDVDKVMEYFTDDIVYQDTTLGHGARNAKQMRRFVQASFDNVPEARMKYVSHFCAGDDYVYEWVMNPMQIPGVSVGKLRDGKICENRDYWDGAKFTVPNA